MNPIVLPPSLFDKSTQLRQLVNPSTKIYFYMSLIGKFPIKSCGWNLCICIIRPHSASSAGAICLNRIMTLRNWSILQASKPDDKPWLEWEIHHKKGTWFMWLNHDVVSKSGEILDEWAAAEQMCENHFCSFLTVHTWRSRIPMSPLILTGWLCHTLTKGLRLRFIHTQTHARTNTFRYSKLSLSSIVHAAKNLLDWR